MPRHHRARTSDPGPHACGQHHCRIAFCRVCDVNDEGADEQSTTQVKHTPLNRYQLTETLASHRHWQRRVRVSKTIK
jgi:hypothetical protein